MNEIANVNGAPVRNSYFSSLLKSGTVVNGAHWAVLKDQREFESLSEINNAPKGRLHSPIQHAAALKVFEDRLAETNFKIGDRVGMLSPNTEKFVYVVDVKNEIADDFVFQLGFINYNNRAMSARIIASDKCFVCSNNTYRGLTDEKQRHVGDALSGFNSLIDSGIEKFNSYVDARIEEIDAFKDTEIDDAKLSKILLEMHRSPVFSKDPAMIGRIFTEFDQQHGDQPRHEEFSDYSIWSFQNCATEQLKSVNPARRLITDSAMLNILNGVALEL